MVEKVGGGMEKKSEKNVNTHKINNAVDLFYFLIILIFFTGFKLFLKKF